MRRFEAALLLILTLLGVPLPAGAQQARVPADRQEIRLSFAPLVKRVAPAVVNIYAKRVVRSAPISPFFNDPFFRRFFGEDFSFGRPREQVQNSLGSGVIVRSDGIVVTNHHVIKDASSITVALADRREFDARIVGTDERTDLAVLRIDPGGERLPFIPLNDSDRLEVGDLVLAIGNPFGVGQTVTSGIVSANARTAAGISDYNFFIQTDAAINPGNSGGALVAMDGGLVGINTAIYSRSGGSIGIGFAIPSNMVASVVDSLIRKGRVVRPWLGATTQDVTAEIGASLGLDRPHGVIVSGIWSGGPADRAGLRQGDLIVAIDGREVADKAGLFFRFATLKLGTTARMTVIRKARERTLRIEVESAPEDPPANRTELSGAHPFSGATVANLSPALAEELEIDSMLRGVVVVGIRGGSTAARLNFKRGDIILRINGRAPGSVRALHDLLAQRADRWRVAISRDGETITAVFGT